MKGNVVWRNKKYSRMTEHLFYRVVALWKMEAESFVRNHIVCMYTFLPAMKGVTAPMLIQAIEGMEQRYKGQVLGSHLVRFRTILRRSKTVAAQAKQIVESGEKIARIR